MKFEQQKFPHINLQNSVPMPDGGKILPLCDLKSEGTCQGISLIPVGTNGDYHWEHELKIAGCRSCQFHSQLCERCKS